MMDEGGRGRYLTRQDLEAVIRRAAELEVEAGSSVPELSEGDVLRIAGEAGLSEANVRRALAEYQSGAGELLVERGWVSRLCGSGLVTATRHVQRPAEEVRMEVESHLQANESMRLVRRTNCGSLWEPDRGIVAALMRGFDVFGRGYQLAKRSRAIEFQVVPVSDDACQISLTTDLSNERAGWFWGLGIGAGTPLVLVTAGVILASTNIPNIPEAAALVAPAWYAATIALARAAYRRGVEKMRLVMDGLLDRVEHDEPLEPPRPSWRDLLK